MRTTSGDTGFDNSRPAARALFALSPKHARKVDIASLFALSIYIIPVSAAAFFNCEPQHELQFFKKRL